MRKLLTTELNRLSKEQYQLKEKNDIVIVLDNIRSAFNVGSIFRTADAFLIKEIVLCGITATPPSKEINKTALGADETVDWKYYKSTKEAVNYLKTAEYQIIGIEQIEQSINLNNFEFDKNIKYCFIFGNEVNGISEEILQYIDKAVEIPQFGTKHSFNVATTAGIVLWDYFCKTQN